MRYTHLLEGLEISIVRLSEAMASASTHRLDAEYFQKQHLADQALVKSRAMDFQSFAQFGIRVDSSAFYPAIEEYYGTGELPFLRVKNVDTVIDFEDCLRIPSNLCERFPTLSRVNKGDIVLTKGGSVARVGLVTQEAAVSRDLIFLNSSVLPNADQAFLYLYAQTNFFKRTLLRSSSQTAQPHLTITLVRDLPAPRVGNELKTQCARMVTGAYRARADAISKAKLAEAVLTSAIGLADWSPGGLLTYWARASEVFRANRMDAEYYNPDKRAILEYLGSQPGKPLSEHYSPIREMFDPETSGRQDFVRNFDLNDALHPVLSDDLPAVRAREIGSMKKRLAAGDVVISRLRAYLREIALVQTSPFPLAVGSSEFIVLRAANPENPELSRAALFYYLSSKPIQTILKWSQDGSHHPRFGEEDLMSLPVPAEVCGVSDKVDRIFEEMLSARAEARALLARAKTVVDIAIEDSETAALKFLRES